MSYSPKYVQPHEIPVGQVPDDYDKDAKLDALELAESSAELDVYDGETIPADEMVTQVESAIKQKATCELVKGTEDPNSSKLGDIADDGTNKSDYAQTFCDRYDDLVAKINSTGVIEGGKEKTSPYVYNTDKPD